MANNSSSDNRAITKVVASVRVDSVNVTAIAIAPAELAVTSLQAGISSRRAHDRHSPVGGVVLSVDTACCHDITFAPGVQWLGHNRCVLKAPLSVQDDLHSVTIAVDDTNGTGSVGSVGVTTVCRPTPLPRTRPSGLPERGTFPDWDAGCKDPGTSPSTLPQARRVRHPFRSST
jgi:hypothetical protein